MNGHFCSWHRVCDGAVEVAGSAGWVVTEWRLFSEQRFVCLTVFGMLGSGGGGAPCRRRRRRCQSTGEAGCQELQVPKQAS